MVQLHEYQVNYVVRELLLMLMGFLDVNSDSIRREGSSRRYLFGEKRV